MKKRQISALALALLALSACGRAATPPAQQAPTGAVPAGPPIMLQAPPVYALIGQRQQLGLTSEQVTALDSIGEWVNTANRPLTQRLRELGPEMRTQPRPETPAAGQGEVVLPGGEAGTVLRELRENNLRAVEGVREVLSEEQQVRVCQIFERTQPRATGAAPGARGTQRPPTAGRPGAAGDAPRLGVARIWPWCAEPTAPVAPEVPANVPPSP